MKCRTAIEKISGSLGSSLPETELQQLRSHISACPECSVAYNEMRQVRGAMRGLGVRAVPPELATRLRVAASRRALHQRQRSTLQALASHWAANLRLWTNNLVRPVAVPFAGGLLSAVFLFSTLVPMFAVQNRPILGDVPTVLTTEASMYSSVSFGLMEYDIVVDVLIDDQGRLVDYSIPVSQKWSADPELRKSVENTLLCTRFIPATLFGQPASGRMRITLRASRMDVKG